MLTDVSIPTEDILTLKEIEKLTKYKELEIDIERLWEQKDEIHNVKVYVIRNMILKKNMIQSHYKKHRKWHY